VVVAGGVEMMTRLPIGSTIGDGLGLPMVEAIADRYGVTSFNQGLGAELMAQRWGLSRTVLDEFALQSHAKADQAIRDGRFEAEITPYPLPDGPPFSTDEGVRPDSTIEALAALRPA